MKKFYGWVFLFAALGFQACEGPGGPPGIDGLDGVDGKDGGLFLSTVFEAEVNFTEEGSYQEIFDLELIGGDNLLIYLALGADEEGNILWVPLPQTLFAEKGMVLYNYLFTKKYFSIFMDASVDPSELDNQWKEKRYFRIVVVPGEVYKEASSRLDFNDYHAVMKWLDKEEKDVETITAR